MKLSTTHLLVYFSIFLYMIPAYSMLSRVKTPVRTSLQKRSYIKPQALKKINDPIKGSPLERFNLGHGLAIIESKTLPNLYDAAHRYTGEPESMPLLLQLTKKMFHRVVAGGEIAVTKNVGKVATFITPETMGILIGALESGQIEKGSNEFAQGIIDVWSAREDVQIKLNEKDGKKYAQRFKRDIQSFFDQVVNQSKENKDALYSLLLAFLYKKIHHLDESDEFHDWIHFMAHLNQYLPVFSDQELDNAQRKLLQTGDSSWMDTKILSVKSKFINPSLVSSSTYTQFLTNNFPLVVSTIIEKNRNQSIYPPVVISGVFGYKGGRKKADCVETATREVILNLFYNNQTKSFDISKYPGLSIIPALKEYLTLCTPANINSVAMGQLFFDMVSGRDPEIKYAEKNYEMNSEESNILTMLNILFGTHAVDWHDLGTNLTASSDNRMEIQCDTEGMKGHEALVTINILDKEASVTRVLTLRISKQHSYVVFPRKQKADNNIDLAYLLQAPSINPQVQSLFYLNPDVKLKISKKQAQCLGSLLYCSWPIDTESEKTTVIKNILEKYPNDKDATFYAYGLFKSLDPVRINFLENINLLKAYCKDKDVAFINTTKDAFVTEIGIWPLTDLLKEMSFNDAKKLLSPIMSEEYFNTQLTQNLDFLSDLLGQKQGKEVLAYILKHNLEKIDLISKDVVFEAIIGSLNEPHFIKEFQKDHPTAVSKLLDIVINGADTYHSKMQVCSLLLQQNLTGTDDIFYNYFYQQIFPLYISLLSKDYFGNSKRLVDVRLQLPKNSEIYRMYNEKINELERKAITLKE